MPGRCYIVGRNADGAGKGGGEARARLIDSVQRQFAAARQQSCPVSDT